MFASTSRISTQAAARVCAANTRAIARFPALRVGGARTFQRLQSSSAASGQSSSPRGLGGSHLAAGVAGGAVVVLGGYAWYHFSGVKKAVDSAKAAKAYFQETKENFLQKAPKSPNAALNALRKIVKSYAGVVPGGTAFVDSSFDALDELHDTHGEDVDKILSDAYNEVQELARDDKSGADVQTAMKILDVLRRRSAELQEVAKKARKDAFGQLEEKHPQVAQTLGSGYHQLKQMAAKGGPEAKKIFDETTSQVTAIFAKGVSSDALSQARELIQAKSARIRELTQHKSQETWDASVEQASPYLDKLPEVRQLLSDNAHKLVASGGRAKEVFEKVKKVASAEEGEKSEKLKELKEFVVKKVKEAEKTGEEDVE